MEIDSVYILTIIITISLIFLGLIKRTSNILFSIQILWMYILMAGNTLSIDMGVHNNIYISAEDGNIKDIYSLICYLSSNIGLDFVEMNAIIVALVTILIVYIIKKYSKSPCFVLSLLYIYPLTEYIIQKRFFTAFAVVLLSMVFFLFRKGYIYILLYIIGIIIAGKIHSSAFAYLIFLLVPFLENTKRKKVIFVFFMIIVTSISPIMPELVGIIEESKSETYFEVLHEKIKYPILNTFLWSGFHIGFVYLFHCFYKIIDKSILNIKQVSFIKHVYYINICSLLFIPFYAWEPTFFRFYRNLLLLNYISISTVLPNNQIFHKSVFYRTSVYFLYTIIAFICIYFFASAGYEAMVYPILYNNLFFDLFRM